MEFYRPNVLNRKESILFIIDCEQSLISAKNKKAGQIHAKNTRDARKAPNFRRPPSCRVSSGSRACEFILLARLPLAEIRDYSESMLLTDDTTT